MSRRRLLVITASARQIPVIRRAQALGLEVVATDRSSDAPGLAAANHHAIVDTRDRDELLSLARRYEVSGVISEQTDVAVPSAAFVAESLGLPGIGTDVAHAATNKWVMRERCRLAGIPTPKYARVRTTVEAEDAALSIGLPVVLKPLDNQSSRGVAKVVTKADIAPRFENARRQSSDGSVLVEEMMIGTESSIESFVVGGRIRVLGICDKVKCRPPFSYDLQLIYPAAFSEEIVLELEELNESVIRAIGIPMGLTHAEMIVTERGVRLIEVAARGCGARVVTDLLPAMTGLDVVGARIRQALGEPPDLGEPSASRSGLLQFFELPTGRIRAISGLEAARRLPGVIDVDYHVKPGDVVRSVESGDARPGFVLAVGDDRAGVLAVAANVARMLHVEMEEVSP